MVKKILFSVIIFIFLISMPGFIHAETNITPNNKFGIHIMFPSELAEAAKLINSNGGDWGYVTIPIQTHDKDLSKWQLFMDEAKRLHVIPIIRLSTNGDFFNNQVWEKPSDACIVDFANFLNSLNWPTKTRYVIVFNEVNRGDEWGGKPNPEEYANILQYAVTTFKSRNPDFFIISSGMDNAAANTDIAMDQYDYFIAMEKFVPGIFNQIDGIGSHSYPNPGFSQPPSAITNKSVYSYKYEKELIESYSTKELPVFITETGWSSEKLQDSIISSYLKTAFENAWASPEIMAVTPFILKAGSEPFKYFSLINTEGQEFERYKTIFEYPKVKGSPLLSEEKNVLGEHSPELITVKKFNKEKQKNGLFKRAALLTIYNWLLKL